MTRVLLHRGEELFRHGQIHCSDRSAPSHASDARPASRALTRLISPSTSAKSQAVRLSRSLRYRRNGVFRLRVASAFGHRDAHISLGGQRPLRRHDRRGRVLAGRRGRMVQGCGWRMAWRRCRQLRPVPRIQLWIALPPDHELGPTESIYQTPQDIRAKGPASVLLGTLGEVSSPLKAPSSTIYLAVWLKAGSWRYEPPANHTICWIALGSGMSPFPTLPRRASSWSSSHRTRRSTSARRRTPNSSLGRPQPSV